MQFRRTIGGIAMFLATTATLGTEAAYSDQAFSAACSFDGGKFSFVVSGTIASVMLSAPNAKFRFGDREPREAFVVAKPGSSVLIVLVPGRESPRNGITPHDTYLIDVAAGSFLHVNEQTFRKDGSHSVVLQDGSCATPRKWTQVQQVGYAAVEKAGLVFPSSFALSAHRANTDLGASIGWLAHRGLEGASGVRAEFFAREVDELVRVGLSEVRRLSDEVYDQNPFHDRSPALAAKRFVERGDGIHERTARVIAAVAEEPVHHVPCLHRTGRVTTTTRIVNVNRSVVTHEPARDRAVLNNCICLISANPKRRRAALQYLKREDLGTCVRGWRNREDLSIALSLCGWRRY
jgi:hypothetical protein